MVLGRKRKCLPDEEIVSRYLAGDSESYLALAYNVSRPAIHRRLVSANIKTRNAVDAANLKRHKEFTSSEELDHAIDGILLGDGWISSEKGFSECRMAVEQRKSCVEWLRDIKSIFDKHGVYSTIKGRTPRKGHINGREIKSNGSFVWRTGKYVNFSKQRKRWYIDGRKKIPQDISIDPISLAHWFCGDGSGTDSRVILYTNGFDVYDVEKLAQTISKNYGWRINTHIKNGKYPVLSIDRKSNKKEFINIIRPFVSKCFYYKFKE